jgi:hypothetical protein
MIIVIPRDCDVIMSLEADISTTKLVVAEKKIHAKSLHQGAFKLPIKMSSLNGPLSV